MLFQSLVQLIVISGIVLAHPGEDHVFSRDEVAVRRELAGHRQLKARNCAREFAELAASRKAKRALGLGQDVTSAEKLPTPRVSSILANNTCITAPDVTEGPYYINNELARYDLTESQTGVELILDIGVLDISTCKPLKNVFVEIWAANATGVYGGYGSGGGGPPPGPPPSSSAPPTSSGSGSTAVPSSTVLPPPPGGPGGPGGPSQPLARNETFLRGGLPTNDFGIVELVTIYPGFYAGRTAHIHAMFHTHWVKSKNGTLVSHAGQVVHNGQLFFDEAWNDKVFATSPYNTNTQQRTLNAQDGILAQQSADGNNAYVDLVSLGGKDVTRGLWGFIVIGVDTTTNITISNTNYYNSTTTTAAGL